MNRTVTRALIGAAAASAAGVSATSAFAQASASQTTTGSATIFQPIALSKNTDLAFGIVVRPSSGAGTVTVSTAGARSLSGNGALLNDVSPSAATFTVNGEGGQAFSINVPASFTMTGPSSSTLTVGLNASGATGTLSGALGGNGSATFSVGGSITVASTTTNGAYTGTFTTTVSYN
jgi:hypothetical protein